MLSYKERKARNRADSTNGRKDFPDCWEAASQQANGNTIPLYCVCWRARNGRITGNSWRSRQDAESAMARKLSDGSFTGSITSYCAGHAL